MEIRYAILGFLSWQPFAGYDLKKIFSESYYIDWSGNSNQIYTALVQLHHDGLVELETVAQESYPPRKLYRITEPGRRALRAWLSSVPEPPELRSSFLMQLAWADQLSSRELIQLASAYEHEVRMQLMIYREMERRGTLIRPARTPRERFLWQSVAANRTAAYEQELAWADRLRRELEGFGDGETEGPR